jgi:hypothetical protein
MYVDIYVSIINYMWLAKPIAPGISVVFKDS